MKMENQEKKNQREGKKKKINKIIQNKKFGCFIRNLNIKKNNFKQFKQEKRFKVSYSNLYWDIS